MLTTLACTARPPYAAPILLKFRVEADSRPCGPTVEDMAQEFRTNYQFMSPPYFDLTDDTDWVPPQPISTFCLAVNGYTSEIWDTHWTGLNSVGWGTITQDDVFVSAKQQLRIKYVDPCGDEQECYLGQHEIWWRKVDANNWQVEEH